jgi:dTDP-4-dehydrorhamnose reductase
VDTWLVTGSRGFLGANTGLFLRGRAHTIGLSRDGSPGPGYDRTAAGPLETQDVAADAIRSLRPTVVLHTAALSSHEACEANPALAERINAEATRELAQAAKEVGAQFVHISTDAVFNGAAGNYQEKDEPNPFSVYGVTKRKGEKLALEANPDSLILRTNFFGWSPTGQRSILEFFVSALSNDQPVSGYTDVVVTSAYVGSLLDAIWQLTQLKATGIVHATSADALSKYDFGIEVAAQLNLDASLISPRSAADGGHANRASRDLSLNNTLLANLIGMAPPTQAAGIVRAREEASTVRAALQENRDQP